MRLLERKRSSRNARSIAGRQPREPRDVLQSLVFIAALVAAGDRMAVVVVVAHAGRAIQLDSLCNGFATHLASTIGVAAGGTHFVCSRVYGCCFGAAKRRPR